jgi:AAA domain
MATFTKATKKQSKLRMALVGPAGSGKTYTALSIAKGLGQRVALIDTERGSASKYSGKGGFEFDVLELESFAPDRYIEGIGAASQAGYDVLVIDSLSHAWAGKDGLLEFVDKVAARMKTANSFAAWREATPLHNKLVDAILSAPLHLIVTMRAKTEYVQEKDERGKTTIRKVGMQPVQRDGLEFEFDVVADLDQDNAFIVSKTRCSALSGAVITKAGADVAKTLAAWLSDGAGDTRVTISSDRAEKMKKELEKLGFNHEEQLDLITEALGVVFSGLEQLTNSEAMDVWKLAKTASKQVA